MSRKKTAGIKRTADGRYEIDRIIIADGKRVHVRGSGYASAKEARDALPALEAEKRNSTLTTDKPFERFCDEFERARSAQVKEQTIETFHYIVSKHILPHFAKMSVREAFLIKNVSKWYASKVASSTESASRKNKIFFVFRQLVDGAWKRHLITSDAHQDIMALVEKVRMPNQAREEKATWNYEQECNFLQAIPEDSDDRVMFSLFCFLGCRIAEFLALQWKCFDEERRLIKIGQQVIQTLRGRIVTTELKTNDSYRCNPLSEGLVEMLKKLKATYKAKSNDDFIFPSPYSVKEPLSKTEFRRRFYKYIEKAGVPRITPHGVRHFRATMLASVCHNAEEIAVGAKFLGHSPTMFMETYVSKNGISQSDLIKRLNKGEQE